MKNSYTYEIGDCKSTIDHFVVNHDFVCLVKNSSFINDPLNLSDHCSIMIEIVKKTESMQTNDVAFSKLPY